MITVRKMEDENWMQTWYFAEATKLNGRATGRTRELAVMNLKGVIRNKLRKDNV